MQFPKTLETRRASRESAVFSDASGYHDRGGGHHVSVIVGFGPKSRHITLVSPVNCYRSATVTQGARGDAMTDTRRRLVSPSDTEPVDSGTRAAGERTQAGTPGLLRGT
ncbi:hypothetical protein EYF80_046543 [Liparis tanakae]|uniref:Uncharacterized protein n=1 Tax=Liparis tanakae TaxID=230148 RepID=A0A4Z2FS95_9TELE|nr:hypothetical protein EYF80_046543 [Liparis tanakae]